ncbi:E3 ubiquitin-protein ligase RFWD3 like protein [Aduncisulcus paluster]|uniref:E3 ubiquitin-protein ligase RFWD3 like protein n=1 Tax=Aduncisulcus paluster TaxID=2918883 RepID=A0ABQ5JVR3_9EUKA|nr:E3 ubiquitin-protein ligase RFWD3 like protein [Aduncisulcus paluster]
MSDDSLSCPICYGPFNEPSVLKCGHIFCTSCITQWLTSQSGKICPLCRNESAIEDLRRIFFKDIGFSSVSGIGDEEELKKTTELLTKLRKKATEQSAAHTAILSLLKELEAHKQDLLTATHTIRSLVKREKLLESILMRQNNRFPNSMTHSLHEISSYKYDIPIPPNEERLRHVVSSGLAGPLIADQYKQIQAIRQCTGHPPLPISIASRILGNVSALYSPMQRPLVICSKWKRESSDIFSFSHDPFSTVRKEGSISMPMTNIQCVRGSHRDVRLIGLGTTDGSFHLLDLQGLWKKLEEEEAKHLEEEQAKESEYKSRIISHTSEKEAKKDDATSNESENEEMFAWKDSSKRRTLQSPPISSSAKPKIVRRSEHASIESDFETMFSNQSQFQSSKSSISSGKEEDDSLYGESDEKLLANALDGFWDSVKSRTDFLSDSSSIFRPQKRPSLIDGTDHVSAMDEEEIEAPSASPLFTPIFRHSFHDSVSVGTSTFPSSVYSCGFSPFAPHAVCGLDSGRVGIIDMTSGMEINSFDFRAPIIDAQYTFHPAILVVATPNSTQFIDTREKLTKLQESKLHAPITVAKRGTRSYFGYKSKNSQHKDIPNVEFPHPHGNFVTGVSLDPQTDGRMFCCGGKNNVVQIFDIRNTHSCYNRVELEMNVNSQTPPRFKDGHRTFPGILSTCIGQFTPGGDLAACSTDGYFVLFDRMNALQSDKPSPIFEKLHPKACVGMDWSPSGETCHVIEIDKLNIYDLFLKKLK